MKKNRRNLSTLICTLLLATAAAFCQADASEAQRESDVIPSSQRATQPGPKVMPGSRDVEAYPQGSSENGRWTIRVYAWSSATSQDAEPKEGDPATLSRGFTIAALNATNRMQFTERSIAYSIKMGSLLSEFWIQTGLDSIDDSLRMAALSVTNDADRQAFQQLETQSQRLRLWSDWLLEQNRRMQLGEYLTSPSRLDDDEQFQSTVTCTNFLLSTLANGRMAEDIPLRCSRGSWEN